MNNRGKMKIVSVVIAVAMLLSIMPMMAITALADVTQATSVKLTSITYSVDGGEPILIPGFVSRNDPNTAASHAAGNTTREVYNIALPADAQSITLEVVTADSNAYVKWMNAGDGAGTGTPLGTTNQYTMSLSSGVADVDATILAETPGAFRRRIVRFAIAKLPPEKDYFIWSEGLEGRNVGPNWASASTTQYGKTNFREIVGTHSVAAHEPGNIANTKYGVIKSTSTGVGVNFRRHHLHVGNATPIVATGRMRIMATDGDARPAWYLEFLGDATRRIFGIHWDSTKGDDGAYEFRALTAVTGATPVAVAYIPEGDWFKYNVVVEPEKTGDTTNWANTKITFIVSGNLKDAAGQDIKSASYTATNVDYSYNNTIAGLGGPDFNFYRMISGAPTGGTVEGHFDDLAFYIPSPITVGRTFFLPGTAPTAINNPNPSRQADGTLLLQFNHDLDLSTLVASGGGWDASKVHVVENGTTEKTVTAVAVDASMPHLLTLTIDGGTSAGSAYAATLSPTVKDIVGQNMPSVDSDDNAKLSRLTYQHSGMASATGVPSFEMTDEGGVYRIKVPAGVTAATVFAEAASATASLSIPPTGVAVDLSEGIGEAVVTVTGGDGTTTNSFYVVFEVASAPATEYTAPPALNVAFGENAVVNVSSGTGAEFMIDGNLFPAVSKWTSTAAGTKWVELDLGASRVIDGVAIYTGDVDGNGIVSNFKLQRWSGTAWADIPSAVVGGNTSDFVFVPFTSVTTSKIRLESTDASAITIGEFEAYLAAGSTIYTHALNPSGAYAPPTKAMPRGPIGRLCPDTPEYDTPATHYATAATLQSVLNEAAKTKGRVVIEVSDTLPPTLTGGSIARTENILIRPALDKWLPDASSSVSASGVTIAGWHMRSGGHNSASAENRSVRTWFWRCSVARQLQFTLNGVKGGGIVEMVALERGENEDRLRYNVRGSAQNENYTAIGMYLQGKERTDWISHGDTIQLTSAIDCDVKDSILFHSHGQIVLCSSDAGGQTRNVRFENNWFGYDRAAQQFAIDFTDPVSGRFNSSAENIQFVNNDARLSVNMHTGTASDATTKVGDFFGNRMTGWGFEGAWVSGPMQAQKDKWSGNLYSTDGFMPPEPQLSYSDLQVIWGYTGSEPAERPKSSNNELVTLAYLPHNGNTAIGSSTAVPGFSPSDKNAVYNVEIPESADKVRIDYAAADRPGAAVRKMPKGTISVSSGQAIGQNVEDGRAQIVLTVVAEDSSLNTYTINFYKASVGPPDAPTEKAKLSALLYGVDTVSSVMAVTGFAASDEDGTYNVDIPAGTTRVALNATPETGGNVSVVWDDSTGGSVREGIGAESVTATITVTHPSRLPGTFTVVFTPLPAAPTWNILEVSPLVTGDLNVRWDSPATFSESPVMIAAVYTGDKLVDVKLMPLTQSTNKQLSIGVNALATANKVVVMIWDGMTMNPLCASKSTAKNGTAWE